MLNIFLFSVFLYFELLIWDKFPEVQLKDKKGRNIFLWLLTHRPFYKIILICTLIMNLRVKNGTSFKLAFLLYKWG